TPRITQRHSRNRPDLLLKLADLTGIHRIVPAIVRAWCYFIGDKTTIVEHEKLNTHNTHVIKCFRNTPSCPRSLLEDVGTVQAWSRSGHRKNAIAVLIARRQV